MDPKRSTVTTRKGSLCSGKDPLPGSWSLVGAAPSASPRNPAFSRLIRSVRYTGSPEFELVQQRVRSRALGEIEQADVAQWHSHNGVQPVVSIRLQLLWKGGTWRPVVKNQTGSHFRWYSEEDVPRLGGLSVQHRIRSVGGGRAYAIIQAYDPGTRISGGISPIWADMWKIAQDFSQVARLPIDGTARPLSAAELVDERRLMQSRKSEDSCVYLSLYHLATRRTTKDWLLSLTWGPTHGSEQLFAVCRGWVAREGRSLDLIDIRRKTMHSTAASDHTVRRFVPLGDSGLERDSLIVMKVSPDGAAVHGHACPMRGQCIVREFGWPRELGFVGVPTGDCPVEVVERGVRARRVEVEEADEPADRKGKERVVRPASDPAAEDALIEDAIRKATAASIDEAFAAAGGVTPNPEASSSTEAAAAVCIDCGNKFAVWQVETRPADRCKKCHEKRLKRPAIDPTAPSAVRPAVVQVRMREEPQPPKQSDEPATIGSDVMVQTGSSDQNIAIQTDDREVIRYFDPDFHPVYEGCVMQLPISVRWRCGWWSAEGGDFGCTDLLARSVPGGKFIPGIAPTLCAAQLEYVTEWGRTPYYVPIKQQSGIKETTNGIITQGSLKAQTFIEGSIIKVRGNRLVARAVLLEIQGQRFEALRLELLDSGSFKSLIGGRIFIGTARLLQYRPGAGSVPDKVRLAAKWQGAVKTEKDSLTQGFVQVARGHEIGKDKPADPDVIVPFLRQLAEGYEKPADVSGPFAWGYCYGGCGAERPGKFHGRLCPGCESGQNTVLGKWVESGYQVCTAVNPVRYPGVVTTKRQHPPIKDEAATTAVYGREYLVTRRCAGKEVLVPEQEVMNMPLKETRGARLGGIALDGAIPFSTAPGMRPLVEAVKYRVFKALPDRQVDSKAFERVGHLLDSFLPRLTRYEVCLRPEAAFLNMLEWVNTMANGRRRRALLRALMELRRNGFVAPRDWDIIKPFVKSEHLPLFKGVSDWQFGRVISRDAFRYVPRLIQAPSDYSHLVAGPYLKPIIRGLKEDWNVDNWIFYASVEPAKLDRWLARVRGAESFFWSDYTAFDATYSPEAWDLLEGLYHRCIPEAPIEFWKVLEAWRTPKAVVEHRASGLTLKYAAGVCNCSGRDDTALANALLNGLVLSASFAAALAGVDLTELQPDHLESAKSLVDIAIVGDDSLVACKFDIGQYRQQVTDNIKRFGLVVKTESSDWIGDVTFLGMMPYPCGSELVWGPTIGRRFYKAFWQLESDDSLPAWTRGVARQLSLYRNVPLLSEAATRVDALLSSHKVTVQKADPNRIWASRTAATPRYSADCLEWVSRRYAEVGVTPDMIRRDLKVIQSVRQLPAVVRLEAVERILTVDDL